MSVLRRQRLFIRFFVRNYDAVISIHAHMHSIHAAAQHVYTFISLSVS